MGKSLWVAKHIAQNLGGDVTAQSHLGFGSAFTCVFEINGSKGKRDRTSHTISNPFSQNSVSYISPNQNDISSAIIHVCTALDFSQRQPNLGIDQSQFGFKIP